MLKLLEQALGERSTSGSEAAEGAQRLRTTQLLQEQPRQMPTMLKYQGPVDCGIEPQACVRKPFQFGILSPASPATHPVFF